jgi:pantoate--beta-alanine ligase
MTARRVTTVAQMREVAAAERAAGRRVGLVPTMGALHEGHLANVRLAAEVADTVVVSVFVNPRQFDREDDLAGYPRDLEDDEAQLAALGDAAPGIVFAPPVEEVYPREPVVTVTVAGMTDHLCGATRPGHFDGVATVVTKLFNMVAPDVSVFGRKDYQQLQIVRRLVADLDLPVEIVAAPTVREDDGVALSSRNRRLDETERMTARALPRALRAAVAQARTDRAAGRPPDAEMLHGAVTDILRGAPGVTVDYVEVLDPDTLMPPDGSGRGEEKAPGAEARERLLVALAAHIGPVRLIDNVVVGDEDDEDRLLAAR